MEKTLSDYTLYTFAIYSIVHLADAFFIIWKLMVWYGAGSGFSMLSFPLRTISTLSRLAGFKKGQTCAHGVLICCKKFKFFFHILFHVAVWLLNGIYRPLHSGFWTTYHRLHLQHRNKYTCCLLEERASSYLKFSLLHLLPAVPEEQCTPFWTASSNHFPTNGSFFDSISQSGRLLERWKHFSWPTFGFQAVARLPLQLLGCETVAGSQHTSVIFPHYVKKTHLDYFLINWWTAKFE